MRKGARRLAVHLWSAAARRAGLTLCAWMAASVAGAQQITQAEYAEPTTRYAHAILGDDIEHGALVLTLEGQSKRVVLRLPQERVFEDTAPRLVDVDGDGQAEVVVVESHQAQGARLAIYNAAGLVAATPYIGQRNRWLAPVAVADLDSDGFVELAYIDRPHLAKILRVWRFANGGLSEVAALEGLTNHRIGERDIAGGLRRCDGSPEMVVARADWARLVAVRFDGTRLAARDIGPHRDRASFDRALECE